MNLISQKMRALAPELDPLRIGTGWKPEDLSKPQVFIESTFGDSHPGSGHLDKLVEKVREGVRDAGGHGARYFATDMCDGESQGTDGINYSLVSREMIANMIEIQANATPFDAGVFLASCDKGCPGNLMGMLRVDIPSLFVAGGTMNAGPEMLTLEQLGMYSAQYERGEIDEARLDWAKCNACPSCGACSFIGTASTMQIMAEALGLSLPGSALMPATSPDLLDYAYRSGKRAVEIAGDDTMKPSSLLTMESFENAIMIHAAISGSTNTLLHLPAIAHELGFEITGDTFDRLHRGAHYLLDIRPAGKWPAEVFYYAGGVPAIMEEIREVLHLDVMTVTGKTLGENLDALKESGFYEKCDRWLQGLYGKLPYAEYSVVDRAARCLEGNCPARPPLRLRGGVPGRRAPSQGGKRRRCLHPLRRPQGQRHARDVLHLGSHQFRQGAGSGHRLDHRRPLLRCLHRPCHRPLLPRSRGRRTDRPGRGR